MMKKRTQLLLWRQANRYFSGSATRFALNSGITTGEELIKLDKEYIIPLYEKNPVIFTHGQGVWLYSHDDKKYLDCFSGIAVSALGHAHPAIINAVQDQVTKLVRSHFPITLFIKVQLVTSFVCLNRFTLGHHITMNGLFQSQNEWWTLVILPARYFFVTLELKYEKFFLH
jgi:hypothetical protein